jgi:DNA-binding XRE family transcriptional regulator
MSDTDKPDLSLGDLTIITDERYNADRGAWEVLRELLKPKKWSETTRFKGPRPPKETAKFYLILCNYSAEVFFLEANRYPRYPPNPHSRNWLINLAQRVEDHVIGVVNDIEASDPEKDFSYHGVAEDEMRRTIQQHLQKEMKDHFPGEFPRSISLPPQMQRQMHALPMRTVTSDEIRKIGIDPENASPLLHEVIAQASGQKVAQPAPPKAEKSFAVALDRLLRDARTTPEKIAEKIDVDPTTVYRHKSGRFSPTLSTVGKYEKVLSGILGYQVKLPTPVKRQRGKSCQ